MHIYKIKLCITLYVQSLRELHAGIEDDEATVKLGEPLTEDDSDVKLWVVLSDGFTCLLPWLAVQ